MDWGTQRGWRWCSKCEGLWFPGGTSAGVCPKGNGHAKGRSSYSLVHEALTPPDSHQDQWYWCKKCRGLWFGGMGTPGTCPARGGHVQTDSGSYAIAHQTGPGQSGWKWCENCHGLWFSGHASSRCPAGDAHVSTGSGDYRLPFVTSTVHIHTKTLTPPRIPIPTQLQKMREVYADAGVDVEWLSHEALDLPLLDVLDVGACDDALGITLDQDELFERRRNVGRNDIAVYYVRDIVAPGDGCSVSPPDRPSAAITEWATEWTLAHEVGHLLGLQHVGDRDRLMTDAGTGRITNLPPDLTGTEISTMHRHRLTIDI